MPPAFEVEPRPLDPIVLDGAAEAGALLDADELLLLLAPNRFVGVPRNPAEGSDAPPATPAPGPALAAPEAPGKLPPELCPPPESLDPPPSFRPDPEDAVDPPPPPRGAPPPDEPPPLGEPPPPCERVPPPCMAMARPPRPPLSCGAISDTYLSAAVTPVSRTVRSKPPVDTVAVRKIEPPGPEPVVSVLSALEARRRQPAKPKTANKIAVTKGIMPRPLGRGSADGTACGTGWLAGGVGNGAGKPLICHSLSKIHQKSFCLQRLRRFSSARGYAGQAKRQIFSKLTALHALTEP